jgi:hypothetical protein
VYIPLLSSSLPSGFRYSRLVSEILSGAAASPAGRKNSSSRSLGLGGEKFFDLPGVINQEGQHFVAGMEIHFKQNILDVVPDGKFADFHFIGDFLIGRAFANQADHFDFP